ncbi:MAG: 50S ribosomal protein L20 [Candidatus Eisenbacteria bacterium]|uniref:Large ribosomal subunit protein bL20 n=1 Tax=Eiseniibacteriota bacterium TaxID=2212470 RepID=A0A948W5G0_UNCEI|nr:50S ribosomal protein L20 [Candidatus Eisenbacteria bacterium]MBU1949621.1 50S ribosomal protein L20 [Candidatus Eisenbacteria bacterium]MBU2690369.1 50S ribosomal protein L20 [Candidatus Eisenbacteria bacterium]
MPRTKTVVPGRARRNKVLKANRGAFSGRRKLYRIAKDNLLRALAYAYRDRRQRRRDFRRLWIQRINAASRQHGMSYSRFISGLKLAGIDLDRRLLADLALTDDKAFGDLVTTAREAAEAHSST